KVEPPGGDLTRRRGPFPNDQADPEKSGLFVYLNTNKRGVTADLTKPEGRELLSRLLQKADILIHNVPPYERANQGLDSAALCAKYPGLLVRRSRCTATRGRGANGRGYD